MTRDIDSPDYRDSNVGESMIPPRSAIPKPRAGEHTKGPWRTHDGLVFFPDSAGGFSLQNCPAPEANARRIVACVNALEGVSLEAIENGGRSGSVMQALGIERDRAKVLLEATQRQYIEAKTERDSLAAQNRELREALKDAELWLGVADNYLPNEHLSDLNSATGEKLQVHGARETAREVAANARYVLAKHGR